MPDVPVLLVVEDDEAIQRLLEEAFEQSGFELAFTMSGEEAATLLRSGAVSYGALIIDIGLRGRMTGWELADLARRIDATIPVIYTTGVGGADWPARGVADSILLSKPFAPAQLVTAVVQLLSADDPRAKL